MPFGEWLRVHIIAHDGGSQDHQAYVKTIWCGIYCAPVQTEDERLSLGNKEKCAFCTVMERKQRTLGEKILLNICGQSSLAVLHLSGPLEGQV